MNPESQNWSRKRVPTVSTDTSLRAYQAFDLRSSSRGGGGRTATTFRRPVCLSYDGKHSCPPFDITISAIRPEPRRKRKIRRFCNNIHLLPSQKRKKVYLLTISREGWSLLRNKRREMRLLGQTNCRSFYHVLSLEDECKYIWTIRRRVMQQENESDI